MARPFALPAPSPRLRGLLWGMAAVLIWGIYLAVARASVGVGLGAADLAFFRYGVAGLVLLPWLLRHSPATLAGIGWGRAIVLTVLAGPLFVLVGVSGFHFAPLAHGAVVEPAGLTIGGLAFGALLLGDRLSRARVLGAAIIVIGLGLTAGPSALRGGPVAIIGDALFALAGMMWAGFSVLSRRWRISPLAATAVVSALSAIVFVPLHLAVTGGAALLALPLPTLAEQVVVQGLLAGVVAVFAFGRAGQLLGPARAAALPALVPGVAILIGIPITGELPGAWQIGGLALVTAGLFVTQRGPAAPRS